jgi:hypothetical protein
VLTGDNGSYLMKKLNKIIRYFLAFYIILSPSKKIHYAIDEITKESERILLKKLKEEPNFIFIGKWYLINDRIKKKVDPFVKIIITNNNKEFLDIETKGDKNKLFIRYENADDIHRFANVHITCEKLICVVADRGNKMIFKILLLSNEIFLLVDGTDTRLLEGWNDPGKIPPLRKMSGIGEKFLKVVPGKLKEHLTDEYLPILNSLD